VLPKLTKAKERLGHTRISPNRGAMEKGEGEEEGMQADAAGGHAGVVQNVAGLL